jgi:putative protease
MAKGQPLPDISRFNWKDGFYSPQKMEEYKAANERAAARNKGNMPRTKRPGRGKKN